MTTHSLHLPRPMQLPGRRLLTPFRLQGWHLFVLLVLCEGLLTWFYQTQVLTRDLYHSLLKEQLEAQRIDALFDLLKRISVWGYVTIPLFIGFRILFVAFLLQLPLVLRFIDIPFRQLFRIVAMASVLMLVFEAGRMFHLSGIAAEQMSKADLNWIPLSLMSLLHISSSSAAVQGFFSHFNLFELGFLMLIYRGLIQTGKLKKMDAGLVVLVMWTVIILFQWGLMMYTERMYG